MQTDAAHEWTAHMRSGVATFWLLEGNRLTTAQIAQLTGLTWDGAKYMLTNMSLVLPIVEDDQGRWYWMRDKVRSKSD